MSLFEELRTKDVPICGVTYTIQESTGGADKQLRPTDGTFKAKNVCDWIFACVTTIDGKPVVRKDERDDRGMITKRSDFITIYRKSSFVREQLMKEIHLLTFSEDVMCEETCKCGKTIGKRVNLLKDIVTVEPEPKNPVKIDGIGVVEFAEDTGELQDSIMAKLELGLQIDEMAERIVSIDGKPVPTTDGAPSRKLRKVKAAMDKFDGDSGMTIMLQCKCGKLTQSFIAGQPDFFGLGEAE